MPESILPPSPPLLFFFIFFSSVPVISLSTCFFFQTSCTAQVFLRLNPSVDQLMFSLGRLLRFPLLKMRQYGEEKHCLSLSHTQSTAASRPSVFYLHELHIQTHKHYLGLLHDVPLGGGVKRRRALSKLRCCVHWHNVIVDLFDLTALCLYTETHAQTNTNVRSKTGA